MSEEWYCPKCGPILGDDKYMSAVMWRCGKCNALIIEGIPSHVKSMQERIAALESQVALLDKGYETSRNNDPEDDDLIVVHKVSGNRNDREWTLISKGKTASEALAKLVGGGV